MARSRFNAPVELITLQNMRQNGVRSLDVQCNQCRHRVIVNVDHLPGDLTVPSFGPRLVCTKCGTIGADARPGRGGWQEEGAVQDYRIFEIGDDGRVAGPSEQVTANSDKHVISMAQAKRRSGH
jgi:hypothetical protein